MPPASPSSSSGAPASKDFPDSTATTAVLDRPERVEAPLVLDTEPPRTLRFRDHFALWMNLGVSLYKRQVRRSAPRCSAWPR